MNKVKNKWGQWIWAVGDENSLIRKQNHEAYVPKIQMEGARQAILVTYAGEVAVGHEQRALPAFYDGNPYGDTVPFTIGSNQELVVLDE